jgi:outer membrane protein TolC
VAVFGAWLAAGLAAAVGAAPPAGEAGGLSLADAVAAAVRDNPEIASLRASAEAMRERPAQAESLPDPMLLYGGMDAVGGGSYPDTNEKRLMLEQEFPWFGKRALRAAVAHKDADAMQAEIDAMTRDVIMMVKEAYFELRSVRQIAAATRDQDDVLRRMAQMAETLYGTGQRTEQDVLKAKSEIVMLQQRLIELSARETSVAARLNALLDRPADAPVGPLATAPETASPAVGPAALAALAETGSPEVRAARLRSERDEIQRRLMASESRPDYRLGLEYRHVGDGDDMVMFTVGAGLPVRRARYAAAAREAAGMQTAAAAAGAAAARRAGRDVHDAYGRLEGARRTVALYRGELLPQAEARFAASEAGYRAGRVDFMDLLESERFLLDARVMAVMAGADVGMQSARLERAVGMDLPGAANGAQPPPAGRAAP